MSDDFNRMQNADRVYTAPAEENPFQFTSRIQPIQEAARTRRQHSGLGGVIVAILLLLLAAGGATFMLLRYSLNIRHGENGFSVQIARRNISDPILSMTTTAELPVASRISGQEDHHYEWNGETLRVDDTRAGGDLLSYSQLYKTCAPFMAVLQAQFPDGGTRSGAAIVATEDGAMIASTHLISGAENLKITMSGTEYPAYIIGLDYATDLAVLKIEAQGLTPAQFCGSESAEAGDPVAVIGNPVGGVVNITDCILSAVNPDYSYRGFSVDALQFASQLGDIASGSALVNGSGQVIGIVNPDMGETSGVSFAISMCSAKAVLNELLQNGFVAGRPSSGLTVSELPAAYAAYYGYPSSLYISAVEELSPAYQAGLRRGDVIVEADGKNVNSVSDLYTIINGMAAGDILTVTVFREGELGTISFALMEATNPRS